MLRPTRPSRPTMPAASQGKARPPRPRRPATGTKPVAPTRGPAPKASPTAHAAAAKRPSAPSAAKRGIMLLGRAIPGGHPFGHAPRWHVPDGWSLVAGLDCGRQRDVVLAHDPTACGFAVAVGDANFPTTIPWHVGNNVYRLDVYRRGMAGEDTSLTVVNPGAEDDPYDPVGWTDVIPFGLAVSDTHDAYEGDRYFFSGTGEEALAYQDVAIPDVDDAHAMIDFNRASIVLEVSHGTGSPLTTPADRHDAQMQVEFYDASMDIIGSKETTSMYSSQGENVWTRHGVIFHVPPGTRTVRLFMYWPQRDDGVSTYSNWGQLDAITLDLRVDVIAFQIQQAWETTSHFVPPFDWPRMLDEGDDPL
jgi:hypothetical protein